MPRSDVKCRHLFQQKVLGFAQRRSESIRRLHRLTVNFLSTKVSIGLERAGDL